MRVRGRLSPPILSMNHKSSILFFLFISLLAKTWAQEIILPHLFTYIDSPVVEQRQTFTAEELEEMHVESLPELIKTAGVQMLSYGSYGLEQKPSIRGFTDETVRVIIDGVCVNNAQYGTFDFSTINIDDIEKIEIVRGGFTENVSDEGAVGGAIYITTKKQSLGQQFYSDSMIKSYFNFNCPLDLFMQSLGYKGQTGAASFIKINAKGTFANNRYLFYNYRNVRSERKNAEVLDGNASVNFQHFFGNGNLFSANDLFYLGKKNTPGTENSTLIGLQKDLNNILSFQVIQPEIADGIRLENTLAYQSSNRHYSETSISKSLSEEKRKELEENISKHYINTFKYAGTGLFYRWENFSDSVGLTFEYTNLNSTDDGFHNQFSGAVKNTAKIKWNIGKRSKDDASGNDSESGDNNSDTQFVLTLPLAAKFCDKNFAFTPKLGFGLETPYIDLYLDGYRMTQFPTMDDLYWDSAGYHGNPDLIPEDGWGADFTTNVHNVWLPFSVCVFTNYYENKIKWSYADNTWKPMNVASAFYLGADFNFEKSFWQEKITIKGNCEYLYTRLLDKASSDYGNKIMWTPDFVGGLTLQCNFPASNRFPKSSLCADVNYTGKRYVSNLNISFLDPYFLLNLSLQSKFKVNIKKREEASDGTMAHELTILPYLRLDNLLNTSYVSIEDYPMPGISLSLGCKIKIE